MTSPHFRVTTNLDSPTAREAVSELERSRRKLRERDAAATVAVEVTPPAEEQR